MQLQNMVGAISGSILIRPRRVTVFSICCICNLDDGLRWAGLGEGREVRPRWWGTPFYGRFATGTDEGVRPYMSATN